MTTEDWIWIIVGSALAAVIWILWRGRVEPTIERPLAASARDDRLQKLLDELRDKLR